MPPKQAMMYLWKVHIATISTCRGNQAHELHWNIVSNTQLNEIQIVSEAHKRFSEGWWAEHLITKVEYVGELHVLDGVPLYEND